MAQAIHRMTVDVLLLSSLISTMMTRNSYIQVLLLSTFFVFPAQAIISNGVYTRAGSTVLIPIVERLPLTEEQRAYVNSELDLLPVDHFRGLKSIVFKQLVDGEEAESGAAFVTQDTIYIQSPTQSNIFINIYLKAGVGNNLFYAFSEVEKKQIRDLYMAGTRHLPDHSVAQNFGSFYSAWSTNGEQSLRRQLKILMDAARSGSAPANTVALDRLLTAASLYARDGLIPFYTTPTPVDPIVSGQFVRRSMTLTDSVLKLGRYTLLVSAGQITGVVDYNDGPTRGEKVYFKTPVALPQLAWDRFAAASKLERHSGEQKTILSERGGDDDVSSHQSKQVVGQHPEEYVPIMSPIGQTLWNGMKKSSRSPVTRNSDEVSPHAR